jgi:hypothetical protein
MSAYLYPNLKSKAAFKRAIKEGQLVTASENTPRGTEEIKDGKVIFEGPHFPEAHRFYGQAIVEGGKVTKIT